MGLYLPDDVYDENIPVFVRQETSSALLNMLNSKKKDEAIHKYSHVFPFGMLDNCYDLDKKSGRDKSSIIYTISRINMEMCLNHAHLTMS